MADIYLHSRLANEVIRDMDYEFNEKIVFNGAQGPDPLYYNTFTEDHKSYRFFADRMHDTTTNHLFFNMVHYVKEHLTKDTYSFLVGFICHYALDVKIHPYIYYNVGVYKKDDPETHQYRGLHLKFERSVDAVMIERDLNIKAQHMNLVKKQFPLKEIPIEVADIIGHVLQTTYNQPNGSQMYQLGTRAMWKIINRYVKDSTGIKKLLYKIIDKFNPELDMFYEDMSLYHHIEDYDFLNLSKKSWHHPITNEEYHYSVIDLYDQAVIFAKELIVQTDAFLWENKDIDLSTVFTNISFNTGINCDHGKDMKYFNNYRKKAT